MQAAITCAFAMAILRFMSRIPPAALDNLTAITVAVPTNPPSCRHFTSIVSCGGRTNSAANLLPQYTVRSQNVRWTCPSGGMAFVAVAWCGIALLVVGIQ